MKAGQLTGKYHLCLAGIQIALIYLNNCFILHLIPLIYPLCHPLHWFAAYYIPRYLLSLSHLAIVYPPVPVWIPFTTISASVIHSLFHLPPFDTSIVYTLWLPIMTSVSSQCINIPSYDIRGRFKCSPSRVVNMGIVVTHIYNLFISMDCTTTK